MKPELPWYIAGPLIGLVVPLLLWLGNKPFGLSSSLRHICAACVPAKISFFEYDWKKEQWNLYFVVGIVLGAFLSQYITIHIPQAETKITAESIAHVWASKKQFLSRDLLPSWFSWEGLLTMKGFVSIVIGGFLVGFGTRYANGCTSGHAITGLSNLQWPSLVATCSFFAGGLFCTHVLIPLLFD